MTTLVIAETKKRAEAWFEENRDGWNLEDGDQAVGFGTPLFGNLYDRVLFVEDYILNCRSQNWYTSVLLRLSYDGELRFLH